jgi:hypothetical protein
MAVNPSTTSPRRKFCISVDHNALRQYPSLDKLQKQFYPVSTLNDVINALQSRQEGFKVELVYNVLKVTLREVNREGNDDYLGLPKVQGHLKDICDVIRETTSFGTHSGIDPRTQIYYSRRSSILQGSDLSDDALIVPNHLPARGEKKRHPLDMVSTEEVAKRRELADRRWEDRKREHKRQERRLNQNTGKIRNAQDWFIRQGNKEE